MKRSPNLAFIGGTIVIAVMVMAAFANVANADGCSRDKSAEPTRGQIHE
ncbi:hypothetical protein [Synechococcus sp. MU1611]|nr:hypothetical protein [Synechococcus sp. MU1611]